MNSLAAAGVAPAFVPVLCGKTPPPKRRKLPGGGVAFDLTDYFREITPLPPFGALYRAHAPLSEQGEEFLEMARRVLR